MPDNAITFEQLLLDAVEKPGRISEAYRLFHDYSLGNQLLAMWQCSFRGIDLGPINTYKGWQSLGRQVRKGAKAISLVMPYTCKKATTDENGEPVQVGFVRFMHKANWFVLAQTDGDPQQVFAPSAIRPFDIEKALRELGITRMDFTMLNGNVQGYAVESSIAISPVAALPHKTTFHEMAHVELGHTTPDTFTHSEDRAPKNICEVEAEAVAMLCCASLGLPGLEESRGYIQHWLRSDTIPEKVAQRIFRVANQILKAGETSPADSQQQMFVEEVAQ